MPKINHLISIFRIQIRALAYIPTLIAHHLQVFEGDFLENIVFNIFRIKGLKSKGTNYPARYLIISIQLYRSRLYRL